MGPRRSICLLVALATWASLRIAGPVSKMLGKTGINVATRLMGLLLAAIAVEFIAGGAVQLLPGLARHHSWKRRHYRNWLSFPSGIKFHLRLQSSKRRVVCFVERSRY